MPLWPPKPCRLSAALRWFADRWPCPPCPAAWPLTALHPLRPLAALPWPPWPLPLAPAWRSAAGALPWPAPSPAAASARSRPGHPRGVQRPPPFGSPLAASPAPPSRRPAPGAGGVEAERHVDVVVRAGTGTPCSARAPRSRRRRDDDLDLRRHARPQPQVRIRHVDPDRIGDDVLVVGRVQAHGVHRAVERLLAVGVDREVTGMSGLILPISASSTPAVSFRLVQVGREDEELRRRHARLHRLAAVDLAVDDHAVDGRVDLRVADVQLRLREVGFCLRRAASSPSRSAPARSLTLSSACSSCCSFCSCLSNSAFVRSNCRLMSSQLNFLVGDVHLLALDGRLPGCPPAPGAATGRSRRGAGPALTM